MQNNAEIGPIIIDVEGYQLSQTDKILLQNPYVGGVILFSRNYQSPEQIIDFIQEIRSVRSSPLLITVDQEGGRIQRFRQGLTALPSLSSIGKRYDNDPKAALQWAKQSGWVMASEMLALGVDISFAPVLDIDYHLSEVIGDRSFHRDPTTIVLLAEQYVLGMKQAGMAAIGKHYPGHGGVVADTHTDQAIDIRSLEVLQSADCQPFIQLIEKGLLKGVMPSHVIYQAVDDQLAGFSHFWLQEMLRIQYHFDGKIFSDDLSMHAAGMVADLFERVLLAREAGCDFVLICNNHHEIADVLAKMELSDQKFVSNAIDLFGQPRYNWRELQQNPEWQKIV